MRTLTDYPNLTDAQFKKIRTVGHLLNGFRDQRAVADYEIDWDYGGDDWQVALKLARNIINRVNEIRNEREERAG